MLTDAHKLKNLQCKDGWAKALCSACPAGMLLEKITKEADEHTCKMERERNKKLLLALANEIQKNERVLAHC